MSKKQEIRLTSEDDKLHEVYSGADQLTGDGVLDLIKEIDRVGKTRGVRLHVWQGPNRGEESNL